MRNAIPTLMAMLLLPASSVFSQNGNPGRVTTSQLDTAFITDDFAAAVVLHPKRVLNGGVGRAAIGEIARGAEKNVVGKLMREFVQHYGVSPPDVSRVILLLDENAIANAVGSFLLLADEDDSAPDEDQPANTRSDPRPQAGPAFVIHLVRPADRKKVLKAWTRFETREVIERDKDGAVKNRRLVEQESPPKEKKHDGKTYYDNGVTALHFPDDRTIVGGPEPVLKRMLGRQRTMTPLARLLAKQGTGADAMLVLDVKRMARSIARAPKIDLPRHVARLLDLTKTMEAVTGTIDLTGKLGATFAVETADEKTAAELAKLLRVRLLPLAKALYEFQRPGSIKYSPPAWKPLVEFFDDALDAVQVKQDGKRVVVSVYKPAQTAALGRLIGRYFVEEHKREERKTNLRLVSFAMQIYFEIYTRYPTHGSDATGKRNRLSWRVHILPYLDEGDLYKQFKLDEAWDSPHNKKLIAKMPAIYKTLGVADKGKTSLHVFVGKGTPFGGKTGVRNIDVRDGPANTFLAVEAGPDKADVWTKPGGLPFDPKTDPWKLLGKTDPVNGFLAAMLDGSVFWMRTWTKPETLRRLIQHADRKPVGDF